MGAPNGVPHAGTVDLLAGKHRMQEFIKKCMQRPERDIVVVAHGMALSRALKPGPLPDKIKAHGWGNCEAQLCMWTEEGFIPFCHPEFPSEGLCPDSKVARL